MRPIGFLTLLLVVSTWGSAPQTASAASVAWNQEEMMGLTGQLSSAADELYHAFRKEPSTAHVPRQARVYHKLKHLIRLIRIEARHLASEVAAGGGHAETLPVYKSLMQIVREARSEAPKLFTTQTVNEKAVSAGAILDKITPFYEDEA